MLANFIQIFLEIQDKLVKALRETAFMTFTSLVLAIILGIALGLVLYVTNEPLLSKNTPVYQIVGFISNMISSIPFLILMIFFLPLRVPVTRIILPISSSTGLRIIVEVAIFPAG